MIIGVSWPALKCYKVHSVHALGRHDLEETKVLCKRKQEDFIECLKFIHLTNVSWALFWALRIKQGTDKNLCTLRMTL